MNVLIAPDAFKDSLTARQVAEIMERAVLSVYPHAHCHFMQASDGGEGFLEAVRSYCPGTQAISMETTDPLGRPMEAAYLFDQATASAYVELAQASGIELLLAQERNPLLTSTYGTGLQIAHALGKGAKKIFVGLGGSATNDGGTGMAQANGYVFQDADDRPLKMCGEALSRIRSILSPISDYQAQFYAINDVSNPLYGPQGAAHIYARQKGADSNAIEQLDKGLRQLDNLVAQQLDVHQANTPGAGAAGGSAYGLKSFFKAEFVSGTAFILHLAGFEHMVRQCNIDLVLTGEGKIDSQTRYGKFVYGLAQEASKLDLPVLAVCGKLDLNPKQVKELGLHAASQLFDSAKGAGYSFKHAKELVYERTRQLISRSVLDDNGIGKGL